MKKSIIVIGIALAMAQSTYCCSCVPPKQGEEVCGSDGNSYDSGCFLFCSGFYRNESEPCLTEVHKGRCKGGHKCVCNQPCAYVCGSDGQSYGNDCTLNCARKFNKHLKKVKNGRCGENCKCTREVSLASL